MGQSLSRIIIHVIFSTKGREKQLNDRRIREHLYALIAGVFSKRGAAVLVIGGDVDHIHILALQSNVELIQKTIGEAKRISSLWLKSEANGSERLSKFSWQRGYGAFSVSESNINNVKKYILNQKEHHRIVTFQDEFRKFLEKHHVNYNEKYVWD